MAIQKKFQPVRLLFVAVAMWLSACSVHAQQRQLLISGSLYVPTLPLPSLHLLATDLNPFSTNLSYTVNRYQISPSNVVLVVSYC
jgi:hypothetical protein